MDIQENVPLAPLTTFRIGGPARFLLRARTVEDVRQSLDFARNKGLALLVLGGGSNMLVRDEGWGGVVLKLELRGTSFLEEGRVFAAAGEEWDALVKESVARGLWGIENLSGIPGSCGGAPVQNIGAYGTELKDVLESVDVLERATGALKRLSAEECVFGYRTSMFKKEPERFVILGMTLRLKRSGAPNLSYRDLAAAFAAEGTPALSDVRDAVLTIRAGKFPDLAQEGTAGSFFLNPVVSDMKARDLAERFPGLPVFSVEGGAKISLAFILDRLNLKGLSCGGARLYEHQPLVLVATRGASSSDALSLAQRVSARVREEIGIEIEKEVRVV